MCVCVWLRAYLASIDVVQDEVELLWGLEGVVEPHQEGVFKALQEDVPLCHDVLLLQEGERNGWKCVG